MVNIARNTSDWGRANEGLRNEPSATIRAGLIKPEGQALRIEAP